MRVPHSNYIATRQPQEFLPAHFVSMEIANQP